MARKRPLRIALVVACSQRKREMPPIELRLSSIDAAPEERAAEWSRRLATVEVVEHRAQNLYAGDHWHAACEAYRITRRYSARAEFWVLSAGYGLFESNRLIKPYSATFASNSSDSVWRGLSDGDPQSCLREWWRGLRHEGSLVDLLSKDGNVVIAGGAPYLNAIADDLGTAVEYDASGERISVISSGTRDHAALLPASGRFRTMVGGTDAALNTRLLALLAAEAPVHGFRRSDMTALLDRTAKGIRFSPTKRESGIKVSDEEVARHIDKVRRATPTASRTHALRELRRAGIACGQSRFAWLWRNNLSEQAARESSNSTA